MKKLFILILVLVACFSCGVKEKTCNGVVIGKHIKYNPYNKNAKYFITVDNISETKEVCISERDFNNTYISDSIQNF